MNSSDLKDFLFLRAFISNESWKLVGYKIGSEPKINLKIKKEQLLTLSGNEFSRVIQKSIALQH
jgi:hypothetical protein